jgi:hypothetical protein
MKKLALIISVIFFVIANTQAQDSTKVYYENAFATLDSMISGKSPLSFKRAVYLTENAYLNGQLDYLWFNDEIVKLKNLVDNTLKLQHLSYKGIDRDRVEKYSAIYRVLKDTIIFSLDSAFTFYHFPLTYDFDDIWGKHDWTKMFVSKLLLTEKGNCHSLPYLYKILAEEYNIPAYLALAPNHIYIKLFNQKSGWYNTELTSGTFPLDAWIMASGYIYLEAIQNGLYMDTLSNKQSIAFCMLDLAEGYKHKFGLSNPKFIFQCTDTALKYYTNSITAMLIKAETQKQIIDKQMKAQNVKSPKDLFTDNSIKQMFTDMEQTYTKIYTLGYRRMPDDMYLQWMNILQKEREKYTDNKVIQ